MLLIHLVSILLWHSLLFLIIAKEGLALRSLLLSFVAGSFMFALVMIVPLLHAFVITLPLLAHPYWQAFISSALNEEIARAFIIFVFINRNVASLSPKERLLMVIAIGSVFATIENAGYASSSTLPMLLIRLLVVTPLHMSLSALHLTIHGGFWWAWLIHGFFNHLIGQGYPWMQIAQVLAGLSLIVIYFMVKSHDKPEQKLNVWE